MHWGGGAPSLTVLACVLSEIARAGLRPVVFFDANVGYKVAGRHLERAVIAQTLRIAADQVILSDSGLSADPLLLGYATQNRLRVVSKDRFRDWKGRYPRLGTKGFLVRGDVVGGNVRLPLLTRA
jgi:hypothetical protein